MNPRWMVVALSAAACGKVVSDLSFDSGPSGGGIDAPVQTVFDAAPGGAIDAPVGTVTTIKAIRMNNPPEGTLVMLRGVVVVAKETSGGNGTLILQDSDLGDFSGITLFCNFTDTGQCNLTKAQIDNMTIGRQVDVNANFGLIQPLGTPAPPMTPRLVRATVIQTQNVLSPLVPRKVDAALVAPGQSTNTATQPLLWTYVRIDGPVKITAVDPPPYELPCPNMLDAGTANLSHRAVMAVVGVQDIAFGVRRGDDMANYCLFECEKTCANQLMVNDQFEFTAGVVDTFNRPNQAQHLVVTPVRNTDIGLKL